MIHKIAFFDSSEEYKPLNVTSTLLAHNVHDPEQRSGLRDKSPTRNAGDQ